MFLKRWRRPAVMAAAVALTAISMGVEPAQSAPEATTSNQTSPLDAAIRESAKNYEAAFARGDAAALAAMWAENGTYTDDRGNSYAGRAEIEQLFKNYFQSSKADRKLEIEIKSIKTLADKAAIERGVAQVKDSTGSLLSKAPYTVIHVNNNGKWEMASVNEEPARYFDNRLEELRWLSGEWSAKGKEGEANLSTRWMADKHFMVARFSVKGSNGEHHEDLQVIGVDPVSREIISWIFDSEGGYGRGLWSTDGKTWVVDVLRMSPQGLRASARNVLAPKDSDTFIWRSTDRRFNGLLIPDSDSITVTRIHL